MALAGWVAIAQAGLWLDDVSQGPPRALYHPSRLAKANLIGLSKRVLTVPPAAPAACSYGGSAGVGKAACLVGICVRAVSLTADVTRHSQFLLERLYIRASRQGGDRR